MKSTFFEKQAPKPEVQEGELAVYVNMAGEKTIILVTKKRQDKMLEGVVVVNEVKGSIKAIGYYSSTFSSAFVPFHGKVELES